MTVCVSVKVHECLVFAADSASSLISEDGSVLNVWRHGYKVFNLRKNNPIAGMTCGMGQIGPASISNHAKEFRRSISKGGSAEIDPENYTISQVASLASQFFKTRFAQSSTPTVGSDRFEFWVGGYGSDCTYAEVWKIVQEDGNLLDPVLVQGQQHDGHIAWGGQSDAIQRLISGFDDGMNGALRAAGLPEETVEPLLDQVRQQLETPLVHSAMPIHDAIALADFLVDLTKRYRAFLQGADIVDGPTDIAAITKYEGFKWIKRKNYFPPELNPREDDNA
jgi:hypothetical protein